MVALKVLFGICFIVIAYYMYHPLPDDIEDPWKVRVLLGGIKMASHVSMAASKLGISTEQDMFRSILNLMSMANRDDPELIIETTEIAGVRVRFYEPVNRKELGPAIVFLHGGGWTLMNIDTYDEFTRQIAKHTQITVISVDYRLAPENPFPAPFDDCYAVTRHLLEFGSQFKIDPSKIVIMGDSAGGNLAATVAQKMRHETNLPKLHLQVLIHPVLQCFDFNLPSYVVNSKYAILVSTTKLAQYCAFYMGYKHRNYTIYLSGNHHQTKDIREQFSQFVDYRNLPAELQKGYNSYEIGSTEIDLNDDVGKFIFNPYFSPLLQKDLQGLPPMYISSAGFDVLRDDALLYADRLKKASVDVEVYYDRLGFHDDTYNYVNLKYESGRRSFEHLVDFLKKRLR